MTETQRTTTRGHSVRRNAGYVVLLVICLSLLYLLAIRNMRFFMVPSSSMEPTLMPADYLLTLDEHVYLRGDIVVFDDPAEPGSHLVKRIVGVAGDTLRVFDGALFINDHYASEPYIREHMDYFMENYTVPEGQIFVLGDNRNYSEDSHIWAERSVSLETVVGRVRLLYLPFDRMQKIQRFPLTNAVGQ